MQGSHHDGTVARSVSTPVATRTGPVTSRGTLAGDAWGGFAAMLVALPAAMAYGVAVYSTLGAGFVADGVRAGIIGALLLGLASAAIDGAPRLIASPSAPAAAVLAAAAAGMVAGQSAMAADKVIVLLGIIGAGAGLLQAVFGALGGGRLIKYIPFPVVAGYLSAVGVMIVFSQTTKFLGTPANASPLEAITEPAQWSWPAIVVGLTSSAMMVFARKIVRRIPATIAAVVTGTAVYFALGFFDRELWRLGGNRLVLGPIDAGRLLGTTALRELAHGFHSLTSADVRMVLWPALTLSVLLSVDSLKTCVIVDTLTFSRHDSNRTLLGQGIGNVAAAMFGGMAGSGTMGATLINVESGGRTRWSGIFATVFIFVAVLVLGHWMAWIPLSALAGILVVVGVRMIDWSCVHLLRQRSTVLDFVVIATVVLVAVATNLIAAAGTGVGLAIILFIRDQIRGSVIRQKSHGNQTFSKQPRLPEEQAILEECGEQTTICQLQGSLFFGTTDQLYHELAPDLATCRFLILDLRRVQALDYTATHLFEQFEAMLASRGGWLLFSRLPPRRELRDYLSAQANVDRQRNTRTFDTLDDALQWAEDQILAERLVRAPETRAMPLAEFDLLRDLVEGSALAALEACVKERHLAAGETLFRAGDPSDELFLVRRGTVRVMLPLNGSGYHTLATFGRGHFFGEMAFLSRSHRSATAIATSAADLYAISRAEFDALSRANPVIGVKVFARLARMLAERLRRTDAELRALYDA